MALKSMLDVKEGWQAMRHNSQRVDHYIRDTMSLCGRLGFYTGDLVAAVGAPPRGNDDCAACYRKLSAERKKARPTPPQDGG